MKPHPRIRTTVKWGGAAVTVLLLMAWIGSVWWGVHWGSGRASEFSVRSGSVNILIETGTPTSFESSRGWSFGRLGSKWPTAISWGFSRKVSWYDPPSAPQQPRTSPPLADALGGLGLPRAPLRRDPPHWPQLPRTYQYDYELALWPIPALALLITCVAWRLDAVARRRARLDLCPKCNYDRTGLAPGAVCPECGTIPADGE